MNTWVHAPLPANNPVHTYRAHMRKDINSHLTIFRIEMHLLSQFFVSTHLGLLATVEIVNDDDHDTCSIAFFRFPW